LFLAFQATVKDELKKEKQETLQSEEVKLSYNRKIIFYSHLFTADDN
jgi:hypothetical protein